MTKARRVNLNPRGLRTPKRIREQVRESTYTVIPTEWDRQTRKQSSVEARLLCLAVINKWGLHNGGSQLKMDEITVSLSYDEMRSWGVDPKHLIRTMRGLTAAGLLFREGGDGRNSSPRFTIPLKDFFKRHLLKRKEEAVGEDE